METLFSYGEPPEPEPEPLADRFDLIGEWTTEDDEAFELYADSTGGDGCLLHIPRRAPAEAIGSIYHAGGVLRGVVWCGFACDQPASWRAVLRHTIAANVATWHAEHPQ